MALDTYLLTAYWPSDGRYEQISVQLEVLS
jgi:hypothetical protein